MAPNFSFGPKSTRMILLNYNYRIIALVLAIVVSLFFVQMRRQFRRANDVKEKGTGVCVILEGDGIHVDTREGTIDYIGECASHIFLYDHETEGTIIYNRADIHNYLLITDYIARAHVKYDRYADQIQTVSRHVGASLLQMIQDAPQLDNDFTISIPDNYVLTHQDRNYLVWEDTVSKAYIEQLNLPKELFDGTPKASDIFNLDIYIQEKSTIIKNLLLCSSSIYTYLGKGGEGVKVAIGKTNHYTAWLYYDPNGQHAEEGEKIFYSIRLGGSVWHQMGLIFKTYKTAWIIILLILAIAPLLCFFFGLWYKQTSDTSKERKEDTDSSQTKKGGSSLKEYIVIGLIYAYIGIIILIFATGHNRWPVIGTFFGLYIASHIVMYIIGRIIRSIHNRNKQSLPQNNQQE